MREVRGLADVIVIGAGWGGLTAGAILAHNGLEVKVFESTGHIGGRSALDRKDGFLVDYGIHIISYGSAGPAAKALREIGHEMDFALYGHPKLFVDNEFIPLPTGPPSFLSSNYLSWADKMIIGHGVRRLLMANTGKIADIPLIEKIPGRRRQTVRDFFRILSFMGLVTPDIEIASAGEFSMFLRRAMKASVQVSYPRGGCAQINEALATKIRESGEIALNSRAKELAVEGGGLRVKVHDETFEARAVVYAAPVQKLGDIARKALPAEFLKSCASLRPAAGISIDLCLSEPVSDLDSFVVTLDPITVGQFTSNIDATTAPEGKQLATFFMPLALETLDDRGALDAEQKRLIAVMEAMFPGIMDKAEWERVLRLRMVDGFEPRVGQSPKDRPPVSMEGVDGLFFAGDCVGVPGKSGDVAFASGRAAAHAVLEYLK